LAALSHQPKFLTKELVALANDGGERLALQAARSLRTVLAEQQIQTELAQAAKQSPHDRVREILSFALDSQERATQPQSLARWQQELATGGDPAAGERLFFTAGVACAQCHRVKNRGGRIGPDLSVIARTATRAQLIHSLVEPADDIAPQFQGWMVVTTDGQIITGLQGHLRTGGAVSIIDLDGRQRSIPGSKVEAFSALKTSLMPGDLARTMPLADLRDLVAWLETLK
jgi:putative heme-binding domain-containing protein